MTSPRRALVLVDIQQEYFEGPLEVQYPPHAQSLRRALAAIDLATDTDMPIVAVQHDAGEEAPVFNPALPGFALHPEVAERQNDTWMCLTKTHGSVFAGTDLLSWLQEKSVTTITLIGYMTNNCIFASAAEASVHGIAVEVLSDATGAINIGNSAGFADAETVHRTLMAVLHSNLAAVATTEEWNAAVRAGQSLPQDNLVASAIAGAQRVGAA